MTQCLAVGGFLQVTLLDKGISMDAPVEWVMFIEQMNENKGELVNEFDVMEIIDDFFASFDKSGQYKLIVFFNYASTASDENNIYYCNELRAIEAPEIYTAFFPQECSCNEFYRSLSLRFGVKERE